MATYELYLWEPEVDLSNQEWNETLKSIDQDDPVTIKTVIRQKIYKIYRDKEHTAVHIEKFFSCILEILNKSEYQPYFEGLSDWITEQQGYFNKSPRLVFLDENTLANATSHEFKRALYEAIEQSGVCAYETMNGYLLPSDSIARKNIFKEIFNTYPALVVQAPRPSVTLDTVPQNVTEMKDMLLEFMQQHPIGSQFEVEKVTKEFDDRKQYYAIDFKKIYKKLTHKFYVTIKYNKEKEEFVLELNYYNWNFLHEYFDNKEKKLIEMKIFYINDVQIKKNIFDFFLDTNYMYFLNKYENNKRLNNFKFKKEETEYFKIFLEQLNVMLNLVKDIISIGNLAEFIFYSKGVFEENIHNLIEGTIDRDVSGGFINRLYSLCVYGEKEEYRENIEKIFIGLDEGRSNELSEILQNIEKIANVVKDHAKNRGCGAS